MIILPGFLVCTMVGRERGMTGIAWDELDPVSDTAIESAPGVLIKLCINQGDRTRKRKRCTVRRMSICFWLFAVCGEKKKATGCGTLFQ